MKRPILIAVVGYVIGILWGLYFNSIVLFFILFAWNRFLHKQAKNQNKVKIGKRIRRYQKLLLNRNVMIVLTIGILLGNGIILKKQKQYESIQNSETPIQANALVISSGKEKNYMTQYRIRILQSSRDKIDEEKEFLLNVKKQKNQKKLEYGDSISFVGEYTAPQKQRNTGGFDDSLYCKSIGIYGRIQTKEVIVNQKNKGDFLNTITNHLADKIKEKLGNVLPKEHANLVLGILLGQNDELDKQIKQDFRDSSLSHILAVSGMHVSYLLLGVSTILDKTKCPKTIAKVVGIGFLIFFMYLANQTPSVERACIMSILVLGAGLAYQKSDTITNLAFSLGVILLKNPFSILNRGLILSFLGTIGILVFSKKILTRLEKQDERLLLITHKSKWEMLYLKIKEIVSVSIAAQIMIFPVSLYYFNTISLTFLVSNILVSFLISIIFCFTSIVLLLPYQLGIFLTISVAILKGVLTFLLGISHFFSSIQLSKIIVVTPPIVAICVYYAILFCIYYITALRNEPKKRVTKRKVLNWIENRLANIHKQKIVIIFMLLLILLVSILQNSVPSNLSIHFIDVGQGDATLVITPYHKRILIDTGGSKNKEEFDVGTSTLVPYLLDKGIKRIDYLCISHFDADHCNGALAVIEMLDVRNIVITKQSKISKEYQAILEQIKQKKIPVKIVKQGDRIPLDKVCYLDILYPKQELSFSDLNNNSMVAKLSYANFSMLFTGDIEKEAEQEILRNKEIVGLLKTDILKIAHHGSKTSTTEEFLEATSPHSAMIGVGQNNTFGHPNSGILDRLRNANIRVYRTDENGEITIQVNKKGRIWIDKMLN